MNKRIAEVTAGGEQEFLTSRLIQDGVVRNLEVIGEATKNLSTELREANSAIPWKQIAALHDAHINDTLNVNLSHVWITVSRRSPQSETL